MLADKPTELSRIKLKTWTRQPVPIFSEHSAHLAPLSVDFRTWLWRYTYWLLISMLWHRQAIFKSKGDKLCSSAESRIWTRDPGHQFASRLNARWQTDWAIEDQAKKLELDGPSLWSASIQPTWPHCQLTFAPGSGDIHIHSFQILATIPEILSFESSLRPTYQRPTVTSLTASQWFFVHNLPSNFHILIQIEAMVHIT